MHKLGCLLTPALVLILSATAFADGPSIQVLSNRADLVSGGDALVGVALPDGTDPSAVQMALNGGDVTSEFAQRADGSYEGLVTGLDVGANTLTATLPDGSTDSVTITDHANGGPVFSGPQVQPWVCQNGSKEAKCDAAPTYA